MYTFNISKNPKKIKINLNKKYTYSTLKIYISNFFLCIVSLTVLVIFLQARKVRNYRNWSNKSELQSTLFLT